MLADVLSITAIVISLVSLAWQVVTWRQSGPVVKVTTGLAARTNGADVGEPHLMVTAANKGRAPVTVNSWGLRLPDNRHLLITDPASWSTPLPHRLEPGADASWYVDRTAIWDSCEAQGVRYQDLIAYVTLGDGRKVYAKRGK